MTERLVTACRGVWRGPIWICGIAAALLGPLGDGAAAESLSTMCSRTEHEAAMPAPATQAAVPRHETVPVAQVPDCWVAWTQGSRPSSAGSFLIDVRPAEKLGQAAIPGALQIKPAEIVGKGFLRQENLLLVGTGYDSRAMGQLCLHLRQAGFKSVFALKGGARAMNPAGAASGSTRALISIDEMSSAEFAGGVATSGWRIWAVDLEPSEIALLPAVPEKTFSKEEFSFLRELLAQEMNVKPADVQSELIVIGKNQNAVEQVRPHTENIAANVFWLSGGWDAYSKYLKDWQLSSSHAGASTKRPCGAP
ncbi:hypothetical protein [Xylophilus sp. Leaf220]|uniref:hypothetical protein n=1 Tax=Xylophilus sp. Leaf220 TaxID=1735686 RepID=UPI0012E0DB01|nr:hypothetical protein [Xylophilus sp. Leaf220]